MAVSSFDTLSTQSNGSPMGRLSRIAPARSRTTGPSWRCWPGRPSADRLAMDAVLGLVHGDEPGAAAAALVAHLGEDLVLLFHGLAVGKSDAVGREKGLVVDVDRHDVSHRVSDQ